MAISTKLIKFFVLKLYYLIKFITIILFNNSKHHKVLIVNFFLV
jgi:hypothetical protein